MRKLALLSFVLFSLGCDHATKAVAKGALAASRGEWVAQLEYVENRDVGFWGASLARHCLAKPESVAVTFPSVHVHVMVSYVNETSSKVS